jgi:hypothetical protein
MTPGLGLMKIRYDPRLMIQNPILSPCLKFPRLFRYPSTLLSVFGLKPIVVMIRLYGIYGSPVRRSAIATMSKVRSSPSLFNVQSHGQPTWDLMGREPYFDRVVHAYYALLLLKVSAYSVTALPSYMHLAPVFFSSNGVHLDLHHRIA